MKSRTMLGFVSLCWMSGSWAGGGDSDVYAAREDLARRLNVPLERVEVVSEKPMVWPDSNMGCVRVGVRMDKVTTKGSQLILIAEGQMHYYHARPGETYQFCEMPSTKKKGAVEPPVK